MLVFDLFGGASSAWHSFGLLACGALAVVFTAYPLLQGHFGRAMTSLVMASLFFFGGSRLLDHDAHNARQLLGKTQATVAKHADGIDKPVKPNASPSKDKK